MHGHNARQHLTTAQGVRLPDNDHSLKAGSGAPTLLEDFHLREKITLSIMNESRTGRSCRPETDRPVLSPSDIDRLTQAMRRDDDKVLIRLGIRESLPGLATWLCTGGRGPGGSPANATCSAVRQLRGVSWVRPVAGHAVGEGVAADQNRRRSPPCDLPRSAPFWCPAILTRACLTNAVRRALCARWR